MAFTLRVQDNFTGSFSDPIPGRTPDTLGLVWGSNQGGDLWAIGLTTNALNGGVTEGAIINTTSLGDTQACEVDCSATIDYAELFIRADASGNGYSVIWRRDVLADIQLAKVTGLSRTQLTLVTGYAGAPGDVLRVEASGSNIAVFVNGSPATSTTDATYASGKAGLYGYLNGESMLTFRAYDDLGVIPLAWAGHWPTVLRPARR